MRDSINTSVVAGLRKALTDDQADQGVAWVARLVQFEAVLFDGTALASPATTADQVFVSAPTWSLLTTAGLLTALVPEQPTPTPGNGRGAVVLERAASSPGKARPEAQAAPSDAPKGCSGGEANQWIAYIASKLATGAGLNGVGKWKGVKGIFPHSVLARAEVGGAILALITAAVAVLAAHGEATLEEGDSLVRTHHTTTDGGHNTIAPEVSFRYDPKKIGAINCLLLLLSALGNDELLPQPGPIPEASVDFKGASVSSTIRLVIKPCSLILSRSASRRTPT